MSARPSGTGRSGVRSVNWLIVGMIPSRRTPRSGMVPVGWYTARPWTWRSCASARFRTISGASLTGHRPRNDRAELGAVLHGGLLEVLPLPPVLEVELGVL